MHPLGARTSASLLPMSDDRVETHVVIDDPSAGRSGRCTSRSTGCGCTRCPTRTRSCRSGPRTPSPAPGVLEAFAAADLVLLPPSNPVVSIGTVLAVPGHPRRPGGHARTGRRALADRRRRPGARHGRPGASPRSASRPPAAAVALHYGVRRLLDGWLVDSSDADAVGAGRGRRHRLPGRPAADDRRRRPRRAWPAPRSTSPPSCADDRQMSGSLLRSGRRTASARGRRGRRPRGAAARRAAGEDFALRRRRRRRRDVEGGVARPRAGARAASTARRRSTSETVRVVARRGPTRIVETRHGLVLAAAGVDASGTEPGTVLLLPVDPDASARALRARLLELAGVDVAVVVTDTMGRPWRTGPDRPGDRRRRPRAAGRPARPRRRARQRARGHR